MHKNTNKTVHYFEVRKSANESISQMEDIIDAQILVLYNIQATEGRLNDKEFAKLEKLVKMKDTMLELKRETKKESLLEGKTEDEIRELAQSALEHLNAKD